MKHLGVGFWKGAGIPSGKRVNTFIECGCCGAYHRTDFEGDCREDSERFGEIPEGGVEVWEDEVCHCGKSKNPKHDECVSCSMARKGSGQ